jgi:hypothetical protein
LSNAGGSIELYRPDAPQTPPHPDAGFVPYILVERVKYDDASPWPTNNSGGTLRIDGGGASLSRRYSYEFGNDPTNWFGQLPTPGFYNSTSHLEKPYLLSQPQDYNGSPGIVVPFNALARGDNPITYQWFQNGAPVLGANSASFPVTASGSSVGTYWAVASNAGGSTTTRVATLTVNCPFILSQPTAAFGPGGGSTNVIVSGSLGCFWTVSNVPPWLTLTSETNVEGTGSLTYTVDSYSGTTLRKATLRLAGESYTVLQSPPDVRRPTVTISAPVPGFTTLNPVVTVKGTASDDVEIARVDVQIGSNPFVEAGRGRSWQIPVMLSPGTNIIRARSVDVIGNETLSPPRAVVYVLSAPVTIHKTGLGTVAGAIDQQRLQIGRNYTLTATPGAGYAFSNWTGTIPPSSASRLVFNMQAGTTVTANFVPNPFIPVKGVYNGLFLPASVDGNHHTNSGAFKLTLTERGTYSSSLRLGGKTYAAAGVFDLDGKATNIVKRVGFDPLTVVWCMNLNGADNVTGSVTASNWVESAILNGDRATFNARTHPASLAGRYTLVIPGIDDDVNRPHGAGFGTVVIDGNGLVKFAGTLGDGTKVSQSVSVSKNGSWPFYAPLYANRGNFISWIGFDLNGAVDLHGAFSWVRPPMPLSKLYPLGFEENGFLTGSAYHPPVGVGSRILPFTNGFVTLSGGNLAAPITSDIRLGVNSVVTNASPNALTVKFTLATGLFTGTFTQAGTTRKISFSGAVLQKAFYGAGFFPGTNQTGRVLIEAAPVIP